MTALRLNKDCCTKCLQKDFVKIKVVTRCIRTLQNYAIDTSFVTFFSPIDEGAQEEMTNTVCLKENEARNKNVKKD